VTSDSFDGLRALLVPSNKRPTFGRNAGNGGANESCQHRVRRALVAAENRHCLADNGKWSGKFPSRWAIEQFARVLLHRYGVVFRRCSSARAFRLRGNELGRIYRRWEARGEIRGAICGRNQRRTICPAGGNCPVAFHSQGVANSELTALSAADSLNLQGILTPGPRIPALTANRVLFLDGLPIAALEAGEIRKFGGGAGF